MFDYKKFGRELQQANQDLEQTRAQWQKTQAKMEFLIKHRYKIWTLYAVCLAVIVWGLFR